MIPDNVHIGTAGFSYTDWLGNFYPQFCPQADFLRYYSSKFNTVELDVTFYRIPGEQVIKKWVDTTPENFTFSAKFPRTVTHEGDLESRLGQIEHFTGVIRGLGDKLGSILMQFPHSFKPTASDLFKKLVSAVPDDLPLAVEFRNKAWLQDELYEWLRKRGISLCLVDHVWMPKVNVKTAEFLYIRLLGDHKKLTEDFSYVRLPREEELQWWRDLVVQRSPESRSIFLYFNNHYSGHAPTTANRLAELLADGTGG